MDIYTDGSFKDGDAFWAFVVVEKDKAIHQNSGKLPPVYRQFRQIGGELFAVKQAVEWCKSKKVRVRLFYDYLGVEKWATDKWRAKNQLTKKYKAYMQENSQHVVSYHKVKSHSGDKWNEYVDRLM